MAKTENITLAIEATGAAAAQKQIDGTKRSVEGLRDAAVSAQKAMTTAAKATATATAGGKGGLLGGLAQQLGEGSQLGGLMKLIRGGGAIAGVTMLGRALASTAEAAVEAKNALAEYSGKGAYLEGFAKVARSVPVLGDLYRGGEFAREFFTGEQAKIKAVIESSTAIEDVTGYIGKQQKAVEHNALAFGRQKRGALADIGLVGTTGRVAAFGGLRESYRKELDAIANEREDAIKARQEQDVEAVRQLRKAAKSITDPEEKARALRQEAVIYRQQRQDIVEIHQRSLDKQFLAQSKHLASTKELKRQLVEAEKQQAQAVEHIRLGAEEAQAASQGRIFEATEKRLGREYEAEMQALEREKADKLRGAATDAEKATIREQATTMMDAAYDRYRSGLRVLGRQRDDAKREAGVAFRDLEMAGLRRAADKGDRTAEERLALMELSRSYDQEIEAARRLSQDEAAGPTMRAMAKERMNKLRGEQRQALEQFTTGWRPELVGFQSSALLQGKTAAFLENAAVGEGRPGSNQKRIADNSDKQVELLEALVDVVTAPVTLRVGIGG